MDTKEYFSRLSGEIERTYEIARRARKLNIDPSPDVEAVPAGDLATRVEGLVGPEGIAERIKEYGRENLSRIIDYMLEDMPLDPKGRDERMEQALRTSLAILTEGVVAAPIEGISKVCVKKNPDGSEYLAIYFAGPIRSAGGTAQGLAVLVGDYIRSKIGLQGYRPTKDEVERYVEEIKLYDERASRLQYKPGDDEVRLIVNNLDVCVDGDPTEDVEVALHRDLERVDSNRVRGGMCLVIAEGIAQKSKKVRGYSSKLGLDWGWLSGIGKSRKDESGEDSKPKSKFMDEVVGGRPIFAAPSAKGAFRLRYGRARCSGIAAKSIHPATMIVLDDFIATGTQVKVERPGKGCIITECDTIEGPVVKLKDGSVELIGDRARALEVRDDVVEVLFLGDILVSYGDFLQTNTSLEASGYCEDWWAIEALDAGVDASMPGPSDAVRLSVEKGIPLHPRYTYHWEDLSVGDIRVLVDWLGRGNAGEELIVFMDERAKRVLELLGVPHKVSEGSVVIGGYQPLLAQLGMDDKLDAGVFASKVAGIADDSNAFDLIRETSSVIVRRKVGSYIGCRMGRPEKSAERKMRPAVHALFPIGNAGGRERSVNKAAERNTISVDVSQFYCKKCRTKTLSTRCPDCGGSTELIRVCGSCSYRGASEKCPRCGANTRLYGRHDMEMRKRWLEAVERVGRSVDVKGVMGMISSYKIPEPLEKGILRALHGVYVFKDGTVRHDSTDAPLTHFKPREIGVSVERLRELGYIKDYRGVELASDDQIVELRTQDIIISESCGEYLMKACRFIDDTLVKLYQMERFYNVECVDDILGQLVVGLAPHTSAGVVGRIIGFTKARVCYAHPYWHAAKRRNCDGDEDAVMLLMDALLNFSRKYLPEKRGGKMDAPLVITTIMDPNEIDDEAHKMEVVGCFSREFYEATLRNVNPSEVKVKIVKNMLKTDPYRGLDFTHDTGDVNGPVHVSRYVSLGTMEEKMKAQLAVAEKIRAIDEKEVAEIVINSHFMRDTYGNLRAFSRQHFRCVKCNENYRRVPLVGKCVKCGGRLLLTVSEGNIVKYLDMSIKMAEKYGLSNYLKQRLYLIKKQTESLFTNELAKQASLAEFM
ncbi:MAG: DNA polymerase II large subunit [Candidatus Altiarchaeota archaeon]